MIDLRKVPLRLSLPAALLFGASLTLARPAPQAPEITVVGIDLDRVLGEYPGGQRLEQELKMMEQTFEEKMKALKDEFDTAVAVCNTLDVGTDERNQMEFQLKLKKYEYESTAEKFDERAKLRSLDGAVALEQEVRRGVAEFAKEKGYRTVLRLRSDPRTSQRLDPARLAKFQQLTYDIGLRRDVLFQDDAADVTDDVIRFLKQWNPGTSK